jgi:hypothetical protein
MARLFARGLALRRAVVPDLTRSKRRCNVNVTRTGNVWDLCQPYLRPRRSMIALNFGSFTFSAACEAESHLTTRSCFSGHCLFWCVTSSGKTRTSQTTATPFFNRFSYENEPTERLATAPTTPASSKASRSAEWCGNWPFFGQPFGMIQRRVYPELPKIELFACQTRVGWDAWGNEVAREAAECRGLQGGEFPP